MWFFKRKAPPASPLRPIPYATLAEIVMTTMRNRHGRGLWPEGSVREIALAACAVQADGGTTTDVINCVAQEIERRNQAPHLFSDGGGI